VNRWLAEIRRLDPERDAQRIVFLDSNVEFPWDTQRALELAFFRTYAVPSIAELLASTGELTERARRRYDDTRLLMSALGEYGWDGELGRQALRRINRIHARFEIGNDDYLYVLSALALEPIRWNARFGWRPLVENERQATYVFWREIGRRMGIRGIPSSLDELDAFNTAFERDRFAFTEAGRSLAKATLGLFRGRRLAVALLDEPLCRALGLPRPSPRERTAAEAAVRGRAALVRRLPPRRRAVFRTLERHRTYPHGYEIAQLGPPDATVRLSRSAP
jgi:hypothetical protein